jgi:hypothetical protein
MPKSMDKGLMRAGLTRLARQTGPASHFIDFARSSQIPSDRSCSFSKPISGAAGFWPTIWRLATVLRAERPCRPLRVRTAASMAMRLGRNRSNNDASSILCPAAIYRLGFGLPPALL